MNVESVCLNLSCSFSFEARSRSSVYLVDWFLFLFQLYFLLMNGLAFHLASNILSLYLVPGFDSTRHAFYLSYRLIFSNGLITRLDDG